MKASVHLGFNKTGTTALQSWLMRNCEELARAGVHYSRFEPKPWGTPGPQFQFAMCLLARTRDQMPPENIMRKYGLHGPRDLDAFCVDFDSQLRTIAESSDCDRMVVSSEELGGLTRKTSRIEVLVNWLADIFEDVVWVIYLRRPENWLVSRYAQHVKMGFTESSLAEYVRRHRQCGYRRVLEAWRDCVPRSNLRARLYDETWVSSPGLLADFKAAMDLPSVGTDDAGRENQSAQDFEGWRSVDMLTLEQRELIRAANADDENWVRREFFPDRAALFERQTGAEA